MGAMWTLAVITLAALPLVRVVTPRTAPPPRPAGEAGMWPTVRGAMGDRSYLLLHAGFFTCGFHIAFLVTHLPGEVNFCGLPPSVASWSLAIIGLANIAGSLLAGSSTSRFRSKYILAVMYGSRALLIELFSRAQDALTFYVFAAGLPHLARHRAATAVIVGKPSESASRRSSGSRCCRRPAVPQRLGRLAFEAPTTSGCAADAWRSPPGRVVNLPIRGSGKMCPAA